MIAAGYEMVGEGGGQLWELHRGWRVHHEIIDVKIAHGGRELWVKIVPRSDGHFAPENGVNDDPQRPTSTDNDPVT